MKDEQGFTITCKWSDWKIIDDKWNHDFVCGYGYRVFCHGDESCEHYEPELEYKIGDKIPFVSWKRLLNMAFTLSSKGYGVSVIGFNDMSDNVLTITALPEGGSDEG